MNKFTYILLALVISLLTACGGSNSSETTEVQDEFSAETKGMVAFDLSPHMNLTIMIPGNDAGIPEVTENEMGGVDIVVGKNFGISVLYGLGDLAMLKTDLHDDLVYESTIHKDEANLLVYEKNIPGSGMEAEHHFFYTVTIDGQVYDVQNTTNKSYGQAAIEKMVASAKSLKAKTAS